MVVGVCLAPVFVGGDGEDADEESDDVAGGLGAEVGAVSAVVLDHEEEDEEAGGGDGEEKGECVADGEAPVHGGPGEREEGEGGAELEDAAPCVGAAVGLGDLHPMSRISVFVVGVVVHVVIFLWKVPGA